MIITSSTPQASRQLETEHSRLRLSFETEMWDDNSDVIFAIEDDSLTFPVRVTCRVWITAQALLAGAGVLTVNVDGVANTPTTTVGGAVTASVTTYADLTPGNHTVTITSGVGLSQHLIMVRRGRIPPRI